MINIKVKQFIGNRGNIVKNQFILETSEGKYFQSYESIIAFIPCYSPGDHKTILDKNYWDYSTTTGKYRNQFLNEDKKETERKIKEGIYILSDLNNKG